MKKSNYLDERFIEEVKNSNDIVDVISKYVELKKNGDNHKGLCPFHNEKTPSFVVNEQKQIFKCFGCGESGNVISFLMKKENMSFTEAIRNLCENAHIKYPDNSLKNDFDEEQYQKKQRQYKLHTDIAKYYFKNLQENKDNSMQYLIERGIQEKTIKKFGLGYDSGDKEVIDYLNKLGYTREELLESKIFREKNEYLYSVFFARIIYPILDSRNRVVAFGGRTIRNTQPKYLNSPESIIFKKKEQLYGLNLVKKYNAKRIILVEGYMDVISLNQNGIVGAVASLGTSLTNEQSEIIQRQNKKVYICYDSDSAGILATLRAIDILLSKGLKPSIISLGNYKDPDDFFIEKKSRDFMNLIEKPMTYLTFIIYSISKNYNLDVYSQKLEYIEKVCEKIKDCDDSVEKEYQTKRLAEQTGISIKAIGTKIYGEYFSTKQFNLNNSNNKSFNISKASTYDFNSNKNLKLPTLENKEDNQNEEKLIKNVIKKPEYIHHIMDILDLGDFKDKELISIYENHNQYEKLEVDKNELKQLIRLAILTQISKTESNVKKLGVAIQLEKDIKLIDYLSRQRMDLIKKVNDLKDRLK